MKDETESVELEEKPSEAELPSEIEEAKTGPIERFIQRFFGRKKNEPKKPDPNIYPLY
ncbi:MAG: hypothetical protein P1V35_11945 [Planctomycetota bacterium]|nr:hypothetical protein [Planctomycetota bacterium]